MIKVGRGPVDPNMSDEDRELNDFEKQAMARMDANDAVFEAGIDVIINQLKGINTNAEDIGDAILQ